MKRKIYIYTSAIFFILGVGALLLPKNVTFTLTQVVNYPEEEVFAQLSSFRNWDNWVFWYDLDPDLQSNYNYKDNKYSYNFISVEDNLGEGILTFKNAEPPIHLVVDFKSTDWGFHIADFKLKKLSNGKTQLTLNVQRSTINFMEKVATYVFFFKDLRPQYRRSLVKLNKFLEDKDED